jgi:YebC/PmpR family DNA-binding regulatory protein
VSYQEITYEAYAPGGVALLIECVTDNANRSVAAIRHILERNGGNLGASGSVAWQFERKGQIYVNAARHSEDALLEAALNAGADDVKREDGSFLITTEAADFHQVQEGLRAAGIAVEEAELAMVAKNEVEVGGREAERLLKLLDALEEGDDVQKVHSNGNIDEKVMAEAAAGL